MERKLYEMPEKLASIPAQPIIPTDAEIKAKMKAEKCRKPFGLYKRDLALRALRWTRDYQLGLWQGRVDCARGLDYSDERPNEGYNLGYHEGYTRYQSDRRGWQQWQRDEFDAQYVNC